MRGRITTTITTLIIITTSGSAMAQVSPLFTRSGPYGDPLALVPQPSRSSAFLRADDRMGAAAIGPTERGRPFPQPTKVFALKSLSGAPITGPDDDDDDDDDPKPSRPGTLPRSFAKIPDPTPFLRNRSLGPHLLPDAEYSLTDRATLGVLGQYDRLDGKIGQSVAIPSGSRLSPAAAAKSSLPGAARAKDFGLGLSLEFRFGH